MLCGACARGGENARENGGKEERGGVRGGDERIREAATVRTAFSARILRRNLENCGDQLRIPPEGPSIRSGENDRLGVALVPL